MANEIQAQYASGHTLYAVIRSRSRQVWHPVQHAFENWGQSGHTADDYDLALTDRTGSLYVGSLDPAILPGSYCVQVFRQLGATPADTDTLVSSRDLVWTGTGELTAAKILANKAVEDTVTETIDYYDDDGQTILLSLTLHDGPATLTRTPE